MNLEPSRPTRRVRIAPSILSADFARLAEEVQAIEAAGADYVHFDVMDGHFVPNITIGPGVIKALRKHTRLPFDVHLMIAPVDPFVSAFVDAGADILTVHSEAGPHLHRTLQLVRSHKIKAGVSLNPATSADAIAAVIAEVDLVLVMSVNPGFGGQQFIESQIEKVKTIRGLIDASGRSVDLEVDGGVTAENAGRLIAAGADVLVAGTATFNGGRGQYAANIGRLRAAALA
ncbi:MAG: ribulose-phosphate 3-epimerase [Alphaproteobacteria bacterium]|nr:ribulose-phosphate 3-epimerase [Alphaproteobacteria bacterium]